MIWFMQNSSEIVLQFHEFQSIWRNFALCVEKFRHIDVKSPAKLLHSLGVAKLLQPLGSAKLLHSRYVIDLTENLLVLRKMLVCYRNFILSSYLVNYIAIWNGSLRCSKNQSHLVSPNNDLLWNLKYWKDSSNHTFYSI